MITACILRQIVVFMSESNKLLLCVCTLVEPYLRWQAFVADAASMPLHWIYNVNQIKKLVGNKSAAAMM